jgi:CRISPR-associated protein Csd2
MDPETGQGLVSDVALKRKVRDYVAAARGDSDRFKIYVKLHSALHERREVAYRALQIDNTQKGKHRARDIERARKWMCENYFDIRAFGAVMQVTDFNCGQVRGPMQLAFARSIDQIVDLEQRITRKAVEREDAEAQLDKRGFITGTFGQKSIVPYALYRCHAFYNPHFAKDTGFDAVDLALTVEALLMMFDIDRSSARGRMSAQTLVAFQHSSPLGNAPAEQLFTRVRVMKNCTGRPARNFDDYTVEIDGTDLPPNILMRRLL